MSDKIYLACLFSLLRRFEMTDVKSWNDTWGTINWEKDKPEEVLKKVYDLLDFGADVNAKNGYGTTPLHWAARKGHTDVAKLLIEHGADVNAKEDYRGETPLHWAKDANIAQVLIEHGADVKAKSRWDTTPLHEASSMGHTDVAKLLIDHGADMNAKDKDGRTPLLWAAYNGHTDVVKILKEASSAALRSEKRAKIEESKKEFQTERQDLAKKLQEIRKEYGHEGKKIAEKNRVVRELRKKAGLEK